MRGICWVEVCRPYRGLWSRGWLSVLALKRQALRLCPFGAANPPARFVAVSAVVSKAIEAPKGRRHT
jgi:hypothetical protein